jgi:DNA-binding MarR family transcriptional regulator
VLDALARNAGGLTQVEIAKGLGMRETAATQVVRRLEELGMVSRRPDQNDARAIRVVLTASGRRAAVRVKAAWADAEARLLAGLQPEGVQSARRVLESMRHATGGEAPTV